MFVIFDSFWNSKFLKVAADFTTTAQDRVHTVLIPFFLEKSLNFCASPWKVLDFSSPLNVGAWKVFFIAFWLSNMSHSSQKLKVIYIKRFLFYVRIEYQYLRQ